MFSENSLVLQIWHEICFIILHKTGSFLYISSLQRKQKKGIIGWKNGYGFNCGFRNCFPASPGIKVQTPCVYRALNRFHRGGRGSRNAINRHYGKYPKRYGRYSRTVAIIVGLGAVFGQMLEASGGAQALAKSMIRFFGEKHAPLAFAVTGFIIAIPVFSMLGSLSCCLWFMQWHTKQNAPSQHLHFPWLFLYVWPMHLCLPHRVR